MVGQLPVASAHWADSGGLTAGARRAQRPCAGVVPWITADLGAMKQQLVGKLGDHWAIPFPSRFTAPRWTARPPALCRGPVVALSPPPQALHPPPHSSAWLPWAVVHHQRSEDMCGVGDGDSHVGQRLKLSVQTLGWGWGPLSSNTSAPTSPPTAECPACPEWHQQPSSQPGSHAAGYRD